MVTVIALLLGPGRGGAAAVLHPVLAAAAAQLPAGPAEPGRAQRVRGDLRLQRGRAVHGRRLRRAAAPPPSRGSRSAARSCCCSPAWPAGVLRRPPAHSIQVDAIMETVQRNTLAVIEDGLLTGGQEPPEVPAWAVPVLSRHSGYVQAVHRERCRAPPGTAVCLRLRPRVGEHVVAGTTLAWIWRASPPIPRRTRRPSPGSWTRGSGSGSSGPWSRTPRSGSGSSSTWRARRCPRRSTTRTPRSRPSITCR